MPVTPFHFGLGILAKGVAPRAVSLSAFVASQVVIDCESAYYLFVAREWPVHRLVHTFAIATPLAVSVGAVLWVAARSLRGTAGLAKAIRDDCGWLQCLLGGALGGLTHPLLDGIMHRDIRPLMPVSPENPFLGVVGLGTLHVLLAFAGAAGLALLAARGLAGASGAARAELE